MKAQVNEIKEGLQHFHGSEMFYQIPLIRTRFTNGLKYLANVAECFWLITDVSVIAKSLLNRSHFITIDFKRLSEEEQDYTGYEAEIIYSDGNGNIFEIHRYNFTDFPLDELRLYFVDNTLMLTSEY
ncbi:DUF6876 family protein [Mesonia ostreae]|jgi:hypothetical protein|uniref:DUF6876 domain-containing protein n=4 Tax=Flavobacteriaceae TaxID=49546 RepID=A0A4S8RFI3_9FLAO|nr:MULTISPECIES: DUF6876 family protein [Flavobacteriaceae]MBC74142.1 hypothetical protein [Allomuricauda sp.]MDT0293717.1 hypothetical protein [Mesonia ostreae]THV57048.1 hypothetical protein EZV76_16180 [Allomuricauda alvinocaridis]TXK72007.1 hypothetical protein FT986_15250 [Mesonia sp. K4-1]WOD42774.1 hypothetical protein RNZ46_12325 [Hwangdonia sp. SCSIO 19198]|tara:strand:+ start:374 stop:754 length:381 start_codon:yes stop_codon:yes gene_type:complete